MRQSEASYVEQLVNLYLLRDRAERLGMPRTKAQLCLLIEELRARRELQSERRPIS